MTAYKNASGWQQIETTVGLILLAIVLIGSIWLFKIIWNPTTITGTGDNGMVGTLEINQEPLNEIQNNIDPIITSTTSQVNWGNLLIPVLILVGLIVLTIIFR